MSKYVETSSPRKEFLCLFRKHEFSDLTAIYVDLKVISNPRVLGSVNNQRHVLLMDNAQMYDGEFPVDEFKLILAAYSPDAQVASKGPMFLEGKAGTSTVSVFFFLSARVT